MTLHVYRMLRTTQYASGRLVVLFMHVLVAKSAGIVIYRLLSEGICYRLPRNVLAVVCLPRHGPLHQIVQQIVSMHTHQASNGMLLCCCGVTVL